MIGGDVVIFQGFVTPPTQWVLTGRSEPGINQVAASLESIADVATGRTASGAPFMQYSLPFSGGNYSGAIPLAHGMGTNYLIFAEGYGGEGRLSCSCGSTASSPVNQPHESTPHTRHPLMICAGFGLAPHHLDGTGTGVISFDAGSYTALSPVVSDITKVGLAVRPSAWLLVVRCVSSFPPFTGPRLVHVYRLVSLSPWYPHRALYKARTAGDGAKCTLVCRASLDSGDSTGCCQYGCMPVLN